MVRIKKGDLYGSVLSWKSHGISDVLENPSTIKDEFAALPLEFFHTYDRFADRQVCSPVLFPPIYTLSLGNDPFLVHVHYLSCPAFHLFNELKLKAIICSVPLSFLSLTLSTAIWLGLTLGTRVSTTAETQNRHTLELTILSASLILLPSSCLSGK